jgi:hypothetical protein
MADRGPPGDAKGAFIASCVLVALAGAIESGPLAWALSPFFVSGFLYAAIRSPLRYSLYVLMFWAYVLQNPNDGMASGFWDTPLYMVGTVFFLHLKNTTGLSIGVLSPIELAIFFLLGLSYFREASKSPVDRVGRTKAPKELMRLAHVSLLTSFWMLVWGVFLRGGTFNMALWQLDRVVYLPILAFLFNAALRDSRDFTALGKILLTAGLYRASLCVYIREFIEVPLNEWGESPIETATTHHDSMLFAAATLILLLPIVERMGKGSGRRAIISLPLLLWGMVANDRRMVWVLVVMVLFTLYLITPPNQIKRRIRNVVIALSPLIAAYIAAGWNATSNKLFKPVATIRSVVEPSTDGSSLWREIENYDILFTFRMHPILGHGYGHPFWEVIPLPAVGYPLELYCPHNAVFGIWAFGGFVGYTGLVLLWAGCAYFAMLGYRHAKSPVERVAAVICLGSVLIYLLQSYGDMGLGSWAGVFLMSSSIACAGKLAVTTGAWPGSRPKTKASDKAPEPAA